MEDFITSQEAGQATLLVDTSAKEVRLGIADEAAGLPPGVAGRSGAGGLFCWFLGGGVE
jgi:hypothetical protein